MGQNEESPREQTEPRFDQSYLNSTNADRWLRGSKKSLKAAGGPVPKRRQNEEEEGEEDEDEKDG